jgi:RNA ligase (TIGR02306 family)
MTVYYNGGDFGVCSRNMDLLETEGNSFWQVANNHDLKSKLENLGMNIAIQGELMGPGVQGNRESLKELDMYVFDIFDIDMGRYMPAAARMSLVHVLGLKHVPLIEQAIFSGFEDIGDFMRYTDRPSLHHSIAEGVVFKSLLDPDVSFKVINDGYLLKEKD